MEYYKLVSPTIFKQWTGKRLSKQTSFITSIKNTIEEFVFTPNGEAWESKDIGDDLKESLVFSLLELYTGYYWDARLITYIRGYCVVRKFNDDKIIQEWSGEEFWNEFVKPYLVEK